MTDDSAKLFAIDPKWRMPVKGRCRLLEVDGRVQIALEFLRDGVHVIYPFEPDELSKLADEMLRNCNAAEIRQQMIRRGDA